MDFLEKNKKRIIYPQQLNTFDSFCYFENVFTKDQCDYIKKIGVDLQLKKSKVGGNEVENDTIRRSETSWITNNRKTEWIYSQLETIARSANTRYNYDTIGFFEDLQFTYYPEEGGHYSTHRDFGNGSMSYRKLTLVVMLDDPNHYKGGDLEVFIDGKWVKAKNELGTVIVFPSFEYHRVLPVIKGNRHTLVSWISGPPYR